ncbi:hypothetical protein G6O69_02385 [Pseudenhygromyxa sp. WMMC2535]|uniref:hypothetical protein n=1 Tax=Pseudenhygromyxa sp. WMMC2535 TaxID=2712867 RepID=UPI001555FEC3|nr:hypothetical protein [Pseudenhygromyxa sp. WMMC2535]NVB36662.1 hypothetical protein [Pseudenhygromyxa sp. WMMC2535]
MPVKSATPYIFFDGDASAAITLYQAALGAEVQSMTRFGDVPNGPKGARVRGRGLEGPQAWSTGC